MKEQSENELLFAKLDDKIRFCNTKNKVTHTDFLTEPELLKTQKHLKSVQCQNYFTFGGYKEADRKMIFFYPEKMENLFFENSLESSQLQIASQVLEIIRILLPKAQIGTYEHRDYLSAMMKFGIVREKFGDIVVYPEGADIIIQKETSNYFKDNLKELIRFQKSNIEQINISDIHEKQSETKEISIIVNSMRIDNFIAEICHCSRNKAEEILLQERVMVNYEAVLKNSKNVNVGDIITIRGFGRFVVKEIARKTKSDKSIVILIHNC